MSNLARQELYFGRFLQLDEMVESIERVTAEEVRGIAQEFFDPSQVGLTCWAVWTASTCRRRPWSANVDSLILTPSPCPLLAAALCCLRRRLFGVDISTLKPEGYVSDFARVIDAPQRAQLESYCARSGARDRSADGVRHH